MHIYRDTFEDDINMHIYRDTFEDDINMHIYRDTFEDDINMQVSFYFFLYRERNKVFSTQHQYHSHSVPHPWGSHPRYVTSDSISISITLSLLLLLIFFFSYLLLFRFLSVGLFVYLSDSIIYKYPAPVGLYVVQEEIVHIGQGSH